MHGAAGIFGGELITSSGKIVDATNRDFRFRPDHDEIEAVSGRTQQGRARDDWGNWFGCTNSTLLLHYPTTEHYHGRNPHVATANRTQFAVVSNHLFPRGPLVQWALSGPPGRPTAACGLSIYRDTVLGAGYANNSFTCEPVNQLVHRLQLSPSGVTFIGQRPGDEQDREFLSSTDSWFRPVQTRCGPEGAIYVVDMYRYMIEHPRFLPDEVRNSIDIRAGDQLGRIYRIVPRTFQAVSIPNLAALQTLELVGYLNTANGTLRDMVHQQLLWRSDDAAVEPLRKLADTAPLPEVRLQSLAVLEGLKALGPDQVARAMLDEHPAVRRHAGRFAETWLNNVPSIAERLIELVDDEDAQVRLQIAYSLGFWRQPSAGPLLARLAAGNIGDSVMQDAILSSLHAESIGGALATLLEIRTENETAQALLRELLPLSIKLGDPETIATAVDAVVTPQDGKFDVWQWLLAPAVQQALRGRQLQLQDHQQRRWEAMLQAAYALAVDQNASNESRIKAIALLPHAELDDESFQTLAVLLAVQTPVAVQQAAVAALTEIDSPASQSLLLDAFPQLTPAVQAAILEAAVSRVTLAAELLTRLESRDFPRGMIDPASRQKLVNHPAAVIKSRSSAIFTEASRAEIAEQIKSYEAINSVVGRPEQGRELFTKHCAACHRFEGIGYEVGPDLAALTDKSQTALLKAILDPNETIDQRYASYVAVTNQGLVLTGIVESESGTSLTLKGNEGKIYKILRNELEELRNTGVSLMPEGLAQQISPDDMQHLLSFLGAGNVTF
jgi:putative heme-binding domain-containing protein